jgi:hypothetical protein
MTLGEEGDEDAAVAAVASALLDVIDSAGGAASIEAPRGYPHLGLVITDSVFSLRARYGTVIGAVDHVCRVVPRLQPSRARFEDGVAEFGADDLLEKLAGLSSDELVAFFGNRQLAPGTSNSKAETVRSVAEVLVRDGVCKEPDLVARSQDLALERAVRRVPGFGVAAWRYLLSLSRVERVKPDTMITRWIAEALEPIGATASDPGRLLEDATERINASGTTISVRAVDHLVWRRQSGRMQA